MDDSYVHQQKLRNPDYQNHALNGLKFQSVEL